MERFYGIRSTGCYDWAHPSNQSVCLTIQFPSDAPFKHKLLSESGMEIGGDLDPGEGEDDPFVMVDAIEAYQKRLLFSSGRADVLAKIAWIRANETRLRRLWLAGKLAGLRDRIARLTREADGIEGEIADLDAAGAS